MNEGLSIIIVNYKCEKYIQKLVDHIVSNIKIKNFEIIIVNNSLSNFSWNNTFLNMNNIIIVDYVMNAGFGNAVNRGVKYSHYTYFCILNPDVILEDDTLDKVYNFFIKIEDVQVGAVSCMIKNRDGTRQKSFFMDKQRDKKEFTLNLIKELLPSKIRKIFFRKNPASKEEIDISQIIEVGGFYGSFVMFKKKAFLDVGGFDPDFFMYSEDTDLFRNRFSKKYTSYYYPDTSLIHYVGGTDGSTLMHKQAQVSFLLNLRKTGNYFLFTYVSILSLKYTLLLLHSLFSKKHDRTEALDFFKNLSYLYEILKYPRGYNTLPEPLKIKELRGK